MPAEVPPGLQSLARQARAGDMPAQRLSAVGVSEGLLVPVDLERARKLYAQAAADSDGKAWVYVPPVGKEAPGECNGRRREPQTITYAVWKGSAMTNPSVGTSPSSRSVKGNSGGRWRVLTAALLVAVIVPPAEAADLDKLRGSRQYTCEAHSSEQSLSLVRVPPSWRRSLSVPSSSSDLIPPRARTSGMLGLNAKYGTFVQAAKAFEDALQARAKPADVARRYQAAHQSYAHMETAFLKLLSRELTEGEAEYLRDDRTNFLEDAKRNLAYYSVYAYHATGNRQFLVDADKLLYRDGVILFLIHPHPKAGLRDETGRSVPINEYSFAGYPLTLKDYIDKSRRIRTDPHAFFSLRLYLELSGSRRPAELKRLFADQKGHFFDKPALDLIDQTGTASAPFSDVQQLDKLVRDCDTTAMSRFERIMSFRAAYALATGKPADIEAALQATSVIAASARKRRYFMNTYAGAKYWELRLLDRQRRLDAAARKQKIDALWATGVANQEPLAWYALCHLDQSRCQ